MSTATDLEQETRWLDDNEMAAWLPLVRVVQVLPHALDSQLREEVGISHAYYSMLALLSQAEDRTLSMGELARSTGTTPSRLSHAVDVLVGRGWVERVRCDADRRVQYAVLTDTGMEVVREVAPRHVAQVRRLVFDRLTPEQVDVLAAVSSSILEALDECG
ncbi:MAG: MarR family winged helix-turn-helix transcriptional regulator [Nocardioides sp.]|uniref:MarR family winged helix-turn-helix transcriptional regulator n=1 Tax=Nocardioides sp. TaxID=35761 RepID=UPI003F11618F